MLCAISGVVPEVPVVSKLTGHVYEKSLIDKYVKENGKDPVTGQAMAEDDLIEIQNNKAIKPRVTTATSIPGLLNLFHDEWDALMLEMHQLRQQLNTNRQELSYTLYQHDAALRVVARLLKELTETKKALDTIQIEHQTEIQEILSIQNLKRPQEVENDVEMGEEQPVPKKAKKAQLSKETLDLLNKKNKELQSMRKRRQVSPETASPQDISEYSLKGSFPLHQTTQGGILSLDIDPSNQSVVATSGVDQTIKVFDISNVSMIQDIKAHSRKVNIVQYVNSDMMLSASADNTVKVWSRSQSEYSCSTTFNDFQGEVVALTVHPQKNFFLTASADKRWGFFDIETAQNILSVGVADGEMDGGYTCGQLHPDGFIYGTGTSESTPIIRIWELREQKIAARFEGHTGAVRAIAFSENGYYMASAAKDGVRIWDLRKLKSIRQIQPYEENETASCVQFDYSGLYLACGGPDARIYGTKQDWQVIKTFQDMPRRGVNYLKFGQHAQSMFVGAADHNLRVFGSDAVELAA